MGADFTGNLSVFRSQFAAAAIIEMIIEEEHPIFLNEQPFFDIVALCREVKEVM